MLLVADGDWEPAVDTGEGNTRNWYTRNWSQEERDLAASRGCVTLPAVGWETEREAYQRSHQDRFQCASETQLSPNQPLVHCCWQEGLRSWPAAGSLCRPEALCSQLDP